MPPIRKGDGTPVAAKGISQIRTGDGRILFDGPAIPDSVVEDFERDEPLDDWYGNTSEWSTTATDPLEGDKSAVLDGDSQSGSLIALDESQTGRLPERGDRFSFLLHMTDTHEFNFEFGRPEDDTGLAEGYKIQIRPYQEDLRLQRNGLDASTSINNDDYVGETVEVEIDWGDPTIAATTFEFNVNEQERGEEIDSISDDDDDIDSGSISMAGGEDSEDRFVDRIWITPTDE